MEETASFAPSALRGQLCLLGRSQWFILLVAVGVLLSYARTERQKDALLCALRGESAAQEDSFFLQLLSGLLILTALFFFFGLSAQAQAESAESAREAASRRLNFCASGLVLAAGVMRLWDLLCLQEGD